MRVLVLSMISSLPFVKAEGPIITSASEDWRRCPPGSCEGGETRCWYEYEYFNRALQMHMTSWAPADCPRTGDDPIALPKAVGAMGSPEDEVEEVDTAEAFTSAVGAMRARGCQHEGDWIQDGTKLTKWKWRFTSTKGNLCKITTYTCDDGRIDEDVKYTRKGKEECFATGGTPKCSAHADCKSDEYCDLNGSCENRDWCELERDAIDGTCPGNSGGEDLDFMEDGVEDGLEEQEGMKHVSWDDLASVKEFETELAEKREDHQVIGAMQGGEIGAMFGGQIGAMFGGRGCRHEGQSLPDGTTLTQKQWRWNSRRGDLCKTTTYTCDDGRIDTDVKYTRQGEFECLASGETKCVAHSDCKSDEYCDRNGSCENRDWCKLIRDAIDGNCPGAGNSAGQRCPAEAPDSSMECTGDLTCEYGQECCCGECHASKRAQCSMGYWSVLHTHACQGADRFGCMSGRQGGVGAMTDNTLKNPFVRRGDCESDGAAQCMEHCSACIGKRLPQCKACERCARYEHCLQQV